MQDSGSRRFGKGGVGGVKRSLPEGDSAPTESTAAKSDAKRQNRGENSNTAKRPPPMGGHEDDPALSGPPQLTVTLTVGPGAGRTVRVHHALKPCSEPPLDACRPALPLFSAVGQGKEQTKQAIERQVVLSEDGQIKQVRVPLKDDAFYLTKASHAVPPDPGFTHNPDYLEGLKRLHHFLDEKGIDEVMSWKTCDYLVRGTEITNFGSVDLDAIHKKPAWLINNMRTAQKAAIAAAAAEAEKKKKKSGKGSKGNGAADKEGTAKPGTKAATAFSRVYTLGCWRLAEFGNPNIRKMLQQFAPGKMKWFMYTLGAAAYEQIQNGPAAYMRALLHRFAPKELRPQYALSVPVPLPNIRGRITTAGKLSPDASSSKQKQLEQPAARPSSSRAPLGTAMRDHRPGQVREPGHATGLGPGGRGARADERGGRHAGHSADWGSEAAMHKRSYEEMLRGRGYLAEPSVPTHGDMGGTMQLDVTGTLGPMRRDGGHLLDFRDAYPAVPQRDRASEERRKRRSGEPLSAADVGRTVLGSNPYAVVEPPRDRRPVVAVGQGRGDWHDTGKHAGNAYVSSNSRSTYANQSQQQDRAYANQSQQQDRAYANQSQQHDRHAGQRQAPYRHQEVLPIGSPPRDARSAQRANGGVPLAKPVHAAAAAGLNSAYLSYPMHSERRVDVSPLSPPPPERRPQAAGQWGTAIAVADHPVPVPMARTLAPTQSQLVSGSRDRLRYGDVGYHPASGSVDAYGQGVTIVQQQSQPSQQPPSFWPQGAQLPVPPPPPVAAVQYSTVPAPESYGYQPAQQQQQQQPGSTYYQQVPAPPPPQQAPPQQHAYQQQAPAQPVPPPPPPQQQKQQQQQQRQPLQVQALQQLQLAPLQLPVPYGSLVLQAGGCSMAAPWRVQGGLEASGQQEDASCIGTYCLVVADGVQATRALGIQSGPYALALAGALAETAEAALQTTAPPRLKEALPMAQHRLGTARGACNLCALMLDPFTSTLHIASLGACGYVLLRPNRLVQEMEPVSLWRPYSEVSSKARFLSSPDLRPLIGGDDSNAAYEERLALERGDMLIMGSHGLFDMVWLHGSHSANLRKELYQLNETGRPPAASLATQLASLATSVYSSSMGSSPLAQQLAREGRGLSPLQDVGDVTVVVAWVV